MHDDIRKFSLEGEVSDRANLVTHRDELVRCVEDMMREEGFAPALDLDPQFTLDYDPSKESYAFVLTVYGIEVGEDQAWQAAGMMCGKLITRSTPTPR